MNKLRRAITKTTPRLRRYKMLALMERVTQPPHQNLDASKYGYSPSSPLRIWCETQQFANDSAYGSEFAHSDAAQKTHELCAWMKCKARAKRGRKRTRWYADGALERVTQQFAKLPWIRALQNLRAWMECKENSRNEEVVLRGTATESRKNIDPVRARKISLIRGYRLIISKASPLYRVHELCAWMKCKARAKRGRKRTRWYADGALERVTQQFTKNRRPSWLGQLTGRWRIAHEGMILPTMLIIMLILTIVGLSLSTFVIAQMERTSRGVMVANAMLSAEAGAEKALHHLNQDDDFEGFTTEEVFTDTDDGQATYQVAVEEGDLSNEKLITSTGRYYHPSDPDEPAVQRSIQLVVVGTTALDYSVQTGPGGLIMNNQATISNGDVHVNGYLQMNNQSRIGSADNPLTLHVAHMNCPEPPDETFPRYCDPDEGQPIEVNDPAHIYAEVHANNQTDGSNMSEPGLVSNSGVDEVPLPIFDRPSVGEVISEEGQNMLASNGSCTQNNGETTWANNTRIINGDVEVSRSCTVTIEGNVWINQDLIMRNSGTIQVSDDVEEAPIVMIDGENGIDMRNSSRVLTNQDGIGVRFITFYSTASCSPGCEDGEVTGEDLYDSRDIVTINLRNSSLAAGSSFYARWSKASLGQSGAIGNVMAQTVELNNTGNISFGTEISSGETVWAIKNYQQIFE